MSRPLSPLLKPPASEAATPTEVLPGAAVSSAGATSNPPGVATLTSERSDKPADVEVAPTQGLPLPSVYRGKSSGEFQRIGPHHSPDIEGLIAEAENLLATLPRTDRNKRLLEVAVLRRDTALLSGILDSLRRPR